MNEQAAREWLSKAWHNISGAKLFYEADHYTDVTAVELHYGVEKILKALIAFQNKKIPKTHDIYELYKQVDNLLDLEYSLDLMDQITRYHIEEAYPAYNRNPPPKEEIKKVLDFSNALLKEVCNILGISIEEITA
ncbi:MAG TPA: HEPN domain-containing protein [Campylobacterales bacterium]|nr:HEPN domain-containing protein [Campylobacterales bacterium]